VKKILSHYPETGQRSAECSGAGPSEPPVTRASYQNQKNDIGKKEKMSLKEGNWTQKERIPHNSIGGGRETKQLENRPPGDEEKVSIEESECRLSMFKRLSKD